MSRRYKGAVIQPTGIAYTVWLDFVTERGIQRRFESLASARAFVTASAGASDQRPYGLCERENSKSEAS